MASPSRNSLFLLFVSFFSGGVIFAYEIIVSKVFMPYLGASVYVWTSILTMTLLGLCLGYLVGTQSRFANFSALGFLFFVAAVLLGLSNYFTSSLLNFTLRFEIRLATMIAGLLFVFPVIFVLGMVSPIVVSLQSRLTGEGRVGIVYGISTLGGVIMALSFVYFFIPYSGVKSSIYFLSLILILEAMFTLYLKKILT